MTSPFTRQKIIRNTYSNFFGNSGVTNNFPVQPPSIWDSEPHKADGITDRIVQRKNDIINIVFILFTFKKQKETEVTTSP